MHSSAFLGYPACLCSLKGLGLYSVAASLSLEQELGRLPLYSALHRKTLVLWPFPLEPVNAAAAVSRQGHWGQRQKPVLLSYQATLVASLLITVPLILIE